MQQIMVILKIIQKDGERVHTEITTEYEVSGVRSFREALLAIHETVSTDDFSLISADFTWIGNCYGICIVESPSDAEYTCVFRKQRINLSPCP